MKVEIREERCKACGLCVANCPKKVISFKHTVNKAGYHPVQIDHEGCIGCGFCYITCPDGVYHVLGGKA